jgi:anti-sigma factor RsiW
MGRVIKLHDEHERAQLLLPWYAVGQLDAADEVAVEAHLSTCAECQADLAVERRLCAAVSDLPTGPAAAWTPASPPPRRSAAGWFGARLAGSGAGLLAGAPWLGWALAGPALAALTLVLVTPRTPAAAYHTLGARAAPASGDVVVIFRPEARERDLRAALKASGARLVDGPTAADAYVLHVAIAQRPAALAVLRRQSAVELAEPIDSSGPP